MKTYFNFKDANIGDKVYHVVNGWSTIVVKTQDYFIVECDGFKLSFSFNGKRNNWDKKTSIYPFNPFVQTEERMVEVCKDYNDNWENKVLIKELKNGEVLCWEDEYKTDAYVWKEWREIQPKNELTTEEKINILWEKHNNNG
jgi:hypothetical protein